MRTILNALCANGLKLLVASALSGVLCSTVDASQGVSRAQFYKKLQRVHLGWSKDQVAAILGKPDDVRGPGDSPFYIAEGEEIWCYGTAGHLSLPVLGSVDFYHGRVSTEPSGVTGPVHIKAVNDIGIFRLLRLMDRPRSFLNLPEDPLYLVQCANLLRPMGKAGALGLMREFNRLGGDEGSRGRLFFVVATLCRPKAVGSVIENPRVRRGKLAPGQTSPWPDFPFIRTSGIPFSVELQDRGAYEGLDISFDAWVLEHQSEWVLRTDPIRPPDDPYLSFKQVLASPEWALVIDKLSYDQSAWSRMSSEAKMYGELMLLVRTASSHRNLNLEFEKYAREIPPNTFDADHVAFLAVGAHWDTVRQMYVRRDGSFDSQK
jgi:hypothetical protein